ncbi:hypothetical protein Plhal304r1_c010g0040911 [Plasmopara halstedii]
MHMAKLAAISNSLIQKKSIPSLNEFNTKHEWVRGVCHLCFNRGPDEVLLGVSTAYYPADEGPHFCLKPPVSKSLQNQQ